MDETLFDLLSHFAALDGAALLLLLGAWIGATLAIEHISGARRSMHLLMTHYNELWMQQMITRDPRIFDANILGILRQGTMFFASGSMLAIGGCVALMDRAEQLTAFAGGLSQSINPSVAAWEVKVMVLIMMLAAAFLRFVWALRLYGYCAVVMGAVPNDPANPTTDQLAAKAADLANRAGRSFNRGLRTVYFTIAAFAWLIDAIPLILATLATIWVIYRREFASKSRTVIAGQPDT